MLGKMYRLVFDGQGLSPEKKFIYFFPVTLIPCCLRCTLSLVSVISIVKCCWNYVYLK